MWEEFVNQAVSAYQRDQQSAQQPQKGRPSTARERFEAVKQQQAKEEKVEEEDEKQPPNSRYGNDASDY